MFYTLSWFLSFALLGLWSLACWGLHAVTVWAVASAGALAGGSTAMGAAWPDWVNVWIPPEIAQSLQAMLGSVGPIVQAALETVPFLSGAVTLLAWTIWGLGAVTLLVLAIGAHVLITVLKRRRTGAAPAPGSTGAATVR